MNDKTIRRKYKSPAIQEAISDFSLTKIRREFASIAVTLTENNAQSIETIMDLKEPLIKARNKILDNPLKYFLPYYKKKLLKIDAKLDKLDLALYQLEKKDTLKISALNEIVLSAQTRLKKYVHYLPAKPKNTNKSLYYILNP